MALPTIRRSYVPVRQENGSGNGYAWEPWNDLRTVDRLFDGLLRGSVASPSRSGTAAADGGFELYETKNELIAFLFAPGLNASSFEIHATGETITINAERKALIENTEGVTTHTPWAGSAVSTNKFSTSFNLPVEINANDVNATYNDGVLKLVLPKSEAVLPKQVKVEVGK